MSVATANRAGAVLARALGGHPVEALGPARRPRPRPRPRPPRPAAASPRPTCSPWSRAPACAPGTVARASPSSPTCSSAASGADPGAVRALELALAEHLALPRRRHRPARPGPPPVTAAPLPPDLHASPATARHPRRRPARRRHRARRHRCDRGDLPADPLGLTAGARRRPPGRRPARRRPRRRPAARARPPRAHARRARAARPATLSAPCPSTTPVSLATLGTGLPPGSHGILGFVTDVPGEDRTLNHVQWGDDPDPRPWQARPTVFEQAAARRRRRHRRRPVRLRAAPGLTRAAYRGADYAGAVSPGDLAPRSCTRARRRHRAPSSTATSAELDLTGHVRGVDSASWRAPARSVVDRMVEQLVDGLPDDAALLVTADHGMLDVPADTRLDLDEEPELADGVRLLAGEPRARYVHTEPGAADDVLAALARRSSATGPGWPAGTEAVASGVFGAVDDALAARIGDVVALARGTWAFTDTRARARPEPAGRLPRLAHRDRAGDPAARSPGAARSAEPPAQPQRPACQVRECAGCVRAAGQPARPASDGRLSTRRPPRRRPGRPGRPPSARPRRRRRQRPDRAHRAGRPRRAARARRGRACWAAWAAGGSPARPRSQGSATCPAACAATSSAAVAGHLPVVEAVRQDDDVRGEPVAAEVAALPDVGRARRRQRPGQRPAAQRAAGVVPAVGADQVDRARRRLAHRPVPRQRRAARRRTRADRPPQPLRARAGCRRRPTAGRSRPAGRRGGGPAAAARSPARAPAGQQRRHPRGRTGTRAARPGPRGRAARPAASAGPATRWRPGSRRAASACTEQRAASSRPGRPREPARRVRSPRRPRRRPAGVGDDRDRLGDQPAGAASSRSAASSPGRSPTFSSPAGQQRGQRRRGRRPGRSCVRRPATSATRPPAAVAQHAPQPAAAPAARCRRRARPRPPRLGQRRDRLRPHLRPGAARAAGRRPSAGSTRSSQLLQRRRARAATSSADGVRVGEVDAERQRAAQRRVVGGERAHQVQRRLHRAPTGSPSGRRWSGGR